MIIIGPCLRVTPWDSKSTLTFPVCFRFQDHCFTNDFHLANLVWTLLFLQSTGLAGLYMDVSKNSGTPECMVYNGKPY